ncbi:MAG: outer membrane lipoprotein chaperone LolA [Succinivibrionaceae bacterium]
MIKGFYKFILFLLAQSLFFTNTASADARDELLVIIKSVDSFSGDFEQVVKNEENKVLQESFGELYMVRPNKFKMVVTKPDASELVTDGRVIYNYDELLEQVTIYDFALQVNNSPLILLITDDKSIWDKYDIIKQNDSKFIVTPKDISGLIKQMDIYFENSKFSSIDIIEKDNKINHYSFVNVKNDQISSEVFKFTIPEGVTVDDQRAK